MVIGPHSNLGAFGGFCLLLRGPPIPSHNEWIQRPCGCSELKGSRRKTARGPRQLFNSDAGAPSGPSVCRGQGCASPADPGLASVLARLLPAWIQEARGKEDTGAQVGSSSPSKFVPGKPRCGGPRTPQKDAISKPSAALDRPGQQRQSQGLQTESLRTNWAHTHVVKWDTIFPGRRARAPGSPSSNCFLSLCYRPTPQVSAWTLQAFCLRLLSELLLGLWAALPDRGCGPRASSSLSTNDSPSQSRRPP